MLPLDSTVTVWLLSSHAFVASLRDRLHCVMQNWAATTEAASPRGLDNLASATYGARMAMMLPGSIPGFYMTSRGTFHRLMQILSDRIWKCLLKAVAASLFQQGYPTVTSMVTVLWHISGYKAVNLCPVHHFKSAQASSVPLPTMSFSARLDISKSALHSAGRMHM